MHAIDDIDYGTPRKVSDTMVTLQVDGSAVTVPAGSSILSAAQAAGRRIAPPTA